MGSGGDHDPDRDRHRQLVRHPCGGRSTAVRAHLAARLDDDRDRNARGRLRSDDRRAGGVRPDADRRPRRHRPAADAVRRIGRPAGGGRRRSRCAIDGRLGDPGVRADHHRCAGRRATRTRALAPQRRSRPRAARPGLLAAAGGVLGQPVRDELDRHRRVARVPASRRGRRLRARLLRLRDADSRSPHRSRWC